MCKRKCPGPIKSILCHLLSPHPTGLLVVRWCRLFIAASANFADLDNLCPLRFCSRLCNLVTVSKPNKKSIFHEALHTKEEELELEWGISEPLVSMVRSFLELIRDEFKGLPIIRFHNDVIRILLF